MEPLTPNQIHNGAHAQATYADLPGSPAGKSKGAHDWLTKRAQYKYSAPNKDWHTFTSDQQDQIRIELLEHNQAIAQGRPSVLPPIAGQGVPPVK